MQYWVRLLFTLARHRRWLPWGAYLAAWTVALIAPTPETPGLDVEGAPISPRLLVAKAAHVTAYALLAALSGWLRVPPRYRWLLASLVLSHAVATEWLQAQTGYRSGSLDDVLLDHLGIALGMACTWKWWTAPEPGR